MDFSKRNIQLTFYNAYMKYLSKVCNKLDDDDRQRIKEPLNLSNFEKSAVLSILNDTISKIIVANHGFSGKNSVVELPVRPPMHIRFKAPILDKLYNEETLEPLRECFEAISMSKLEADVEVVRCALEICCKELREMCGFDDFAEFIFNENREAYDEYNLLKVYCENIKKMDDLQQKLKKNHQENEALLAKLEDDIFHLKTESENKEKINRLEAKMVKKWENARQEQVDAVFNHELKSLYQSRDDYEEKTERELIVINELMAFYETKCRNLEESIKSWHERFETEKMQLDEEIKHTEDNIADIKSKYEQIRGRYEEREQFIEEYYIEQKELEEIRKIEAGQRASATRIQAWWRGTMVRNQLGPYRPKKKSKKPKAGKKK